MHIYKGAPAPAKPARLLYLNAIMGRILSQWRILLASLIAIVLVAGAYALALGGRPSAAQASETSALLEEIATKDSTGDGLPDWQKSLYGIPLDATTTDYFHLGMDDGEAVARGLIVPKAIADVPVATSTASAPADPSLPAPAEGTLTAAFSKDFITLYFDALQKANGQALTRDQMNSIAEQALSDLASSVKQAPAYKALPDLDISGSGAGAMKTYAANVEQVLFTGTAQASTSEIFYLKSAAEGDAAALVAIASIAKSYRTAAAGISALSVPEELSGQDLALVNALMHLGEIVQDFTRVKSDTLVAMIALQEYPQAVLDLGNAFIGLTNAYRAAGITLPKGTPGASVVNLIPDIAAEQAASTTTP